MEQLSIIFEPGLSAQHRSLRACVALAVMKRGEITVAGEIDVSPSHLCEKLAGVDSGGRTRGLTLDELEKFIETSRDLSPIYYLIDKFIRTQQSKVHSARMKLADKMPEIIGLFVDAGYLPRQSAAPKKKQGPSRG